MTLQPAYGRDYKSRAAVLADLKAGKDFISCSWESVGRPGMPINLPQILGTELSTINVRYSANRKVAVFKRSELA